MELEKRTYEDILKSFIKELNEKGANIVFEKLSEQEQLELMSILADECKKHMRPFVIHIKGDDWYWFHEYWWNNFIKYDMLCNVAARGLGKSYFWTRLISEYLTFVINAYKVTISSYNGDATLDFTGGIQVDYETNELMGTKVPTERSLDWNKHNLSFLNRSLIKGISITSQIRRVHCNYFVGDDLINDEQKMTPEELKNKIFGTIVPTLERARGKFNLVGTRFTEDDIYAYFRECAQEQKNWSYCQIHLELDEINEKIYFIISDEEGVVEKVLDTGVTDIYSFNRMLTLKQLQPNYFAREYQCEVISDEDVPFPISKLNQCKDRELSYALEAEPNRIYDGSLDSSNSTKKDADETVLMLGHYDVDKFVVIDYIYADNKKDPPQRLEDIGNGLTKFNNPRILAEQNSMGLTNIGMINDKGYRLTPFNMTRPQKLDITDYASVQVKLGRVRLPYQTLRDQQITDKLIHQLSGVRSKSTRGGKSSYDGTTKHDDYYIAFALLLKQLSKNLSKPTKIRSYSRKELEDY